MTGGKAMPPVMVLAAGLGTRMRPITNTLPKPLVAVGGQTMLDRVLDRFAQGGVTRAVINTHHLPDQIEAHCAARQGPPDVALSPEIEERLETGGGVARALPLLDDVFFTTNADSFWVGDDDAVSRLHRAFDPAEMDLLLLLAPRETSVGLVGHRGDFSMDAAGRLARRSDEPVPYNYTGTAIMSASIFTDLPQGAFSLNVLFDRAIASGRLYGHALQGMWLTVGTPDAIEQAERALDTAGHR